MRSLYAVLLAGTIRPSAFGDALNLPVLCLPMGSCGSLLDAWLRQLCRLRELRGIRVVVNTQEQAAAIRGAVSASCLATLGDVSLDVIAEAASWRGAAGIARDATNDRSAESDVLICEAKRLPPPRMEALMEIESGANAVGTCGRDEPAGVYLLTRSAIQAVPQIGYFDLKEQLIPTLRSQGDSVMAVSVGDSVRRVQDIDSYLECVRFSLDQAGSHHRHRIADQAFIASSAVLSGRCIIDAGAVIDERAVVHDSVVLWGATIGEGAVVNRCVIGAGATVEPRARLARLALAAQQDISSIQLSSRFAVAR